MGAAFRMFHEDELSYEQIPSNWIAPWVLSKRGSTAPGVNSCDNCVRVP